jgi:hypothetical protein
MPMQTQRGGRYNSNPLVTSELERSGKSAPCPGCFTPRKDSGTNCTGGWMGLGAILEGRGKSCSLWDSVFGLSSP